MKVTEVMESLNRLHLVELYNEHDVHLLHFFFCGADLVEGIGIPIVIFTNRNGETITVINLDDYEFSVIDNFVKLKLKGDLKNE